MTREAPLPPGSRPRTSTVVLVALVSIVVAGVVLVGLRGDRNPSSSDGRAVEPSGDAEHGVDAQNGVPTAPAPAQPPARICGSRSLLGPSSPPPGFRVLRPSQSLDDVVDASPAGTRFYLATGTHHLGRGPYDQVRPKPGMAFVGAPGAVIDGQGRNRYAFAGHAPSVTISHLTIQNFGGRLANRDQGVVNHDAADEWSIHHNTVRGNGGAGVFLGDGAVVANNCLRDNGQYGFSAYEPDGVRNVVLRNNEITGNNTANWESRVDTCGCTGGGKFWDTRNAKVIGNYIHRNHGVGLWADTNNAAFLVTGNYIASNAAEGLIYETSYNADISFNTFRRNGLVAGPRERGFPTPALYISESGSDPRAAREYGGSFRIRGNLFVDNWSGVVAWENADRFSGSPANTSTGVTTLVNPRIATEAHCSDPDLVGTDPYYDDCRWKTQGLRVEHNRFVLTASHIGRACTADRQCGYVGVFSNYGSYPDWSPYRGTAVERAITFRQDNLFRDNSYRGPWHFMALELGNDVSWDTWRGEYRQDAGSTYD